MNARVWCRLMARQQTAVAVGRELLLRLPASPWEASLWEASLWEASLWEASLYQLRSLLLQRPVLQLQGQVLLSQALACRCLFSAVWLLARRRRERLS